MKFGVRIISTFLLPFLASQMSAQTTFQKTYGNNLMMEHGYDGQITSDGGAVITGLIMSPIDSTFDVLLIRTNANGDTLWTKSIGKSPRSDMGFSIQQTSDTGYVIAGRSYSPINIDQVYIIKTNFNGDTLWTKSYGTPGHAAGKSIRQTSDGGYIISGYSSTSVIGNHDVHLLKIDSFGDTLWTRKYGVNATEDQYAIRQTYDGGYIVAGTTGFGVGARDICLIKTDAGGDTIWTKAYGGSGDDRGLSIEQTSDSGYIIGGITNSYGAGSSDIILIKMNATGNIAWARTYGGINGDIGNHVKQTSDGGYIITGWTESFGTGAPFTRDIYLIKTNMNGDTLWTRSYGGTNTDQGFSVQQAADNGYAILGFTSSFALNSFPDVLLIKTDSNGISNCNDYYTATVVSIPPIQTAAIQLPFMHYTTTRTTSTSLVRNGCVTNTLCTSIGIKEMELRNLYSIFPNPCTGDFFITFDRPVHFATVEIFNLLGEYLYKTTITQESKESIHLGDIASGMYFVKLSVGEMNDCRKLIIE